jgi:hypothetical protein
MSGTAEYDAEDRYIEWWLDQQKAAGLMPSEPLPETLVLVARILRQHYQP